MKKLSKKKIDQAIEQNGKEEIFKFFSERCQEAALDATQCARGKDSKRNFIISAANVLVWAPVALKVAIEFDDTADVVVDDMVDEAARLIDGDEWLFDAYDRSADNCFGD